MKKYISFLTAAYKIVLAVLFGFFSPVASFSQNIANPDFEEFIDCPEVTGTLDEAVSWEQVIASADYYNCDVPLNNIYNTPNGPSSGSAAISIGTYGNLTGAAEAAGQLLAIPFEAGQEYSFDLDVMKVSQNENGSAIFSSTCTGICFYGFVAPPPTWFSFIHTETLDGAVLLGCTDIIDNEDWETKTISFTAENDFTYLVITPGVAPSCQQIIFIDNIRQGEDEDGDDEEDHNDDDENSELNLSLFGPDTICAGATAILNAIFSGGNLQWNNGSTNQDLVINSPGTYTATVVSPEGESISESLVVEAIPAPTVSASGGKFCLGDTISLRASGIGDAIFWSEDAKSDLLTVFASGEYTAISENACGSASETISVKFTDCNCQVYIPNSFTPDGDGINDLFRPVAECDFGYYELSIFNRWGQRIFQTSDPNIPWRGENGKNADYFSENSIYTYVLKYDNASIPVQELQVLKGQVVLLR